MSHEPTGKRRLEALRMALDAHGPAGTVLSRPEHLFYFAGHMPGPSPTFLLAFPQTTVAVAPSQVGECDTVTYTDYDIHQGWCVTEAAGNALRQALAEGIASGKRLGVELSNLCTFFSRIVAERASELCDVSDLLWELRRVKDASEIAQIEANVAVNDRAFSELREALRPGMTGIDVATIVYRSLCEGQGGPVTLEFDIGVGPLGVNPDAKPGRERIQPGDTVFVDICSALHGYYADTTRVFAVGGATDQQREIHAVLEKALAAGEAQLCPGTPANVVDAAVRGVIDGAGYGSNFPHNSGHAYGIFPQEPPYIIPAEGMPLEERMVVTLEPGIFIPGWGGMRLEGNYVIGAMASRRLDCFASELIVC